MRKEEEIGKESVNKMEERAKGNSGL